MANFAGQATLRTTSSAASANSLHSFRASTLSSDNPGIEASSGGSISGGTVSANRSFEMAAGASVTIHSIVQMGTTVGEPLAGDLAMWVEFIIDNTTVAGGWTSPSGIVRSVKVLTQVAPLTSSATYAGSDVTFYATSDGTVTGTPKAGTYRIRARGEYAQVTADAVNGGYHADTDGNYLLTGTPNTWNSTLYEASKGYLRAGAAISAASESNVSPGGAVPTTWTYPDEAYTAATLGAAPNEATNVTFSEGSRSNTVAVTTTAVNDATGLGPLDKTDIGGAKTGNVVVKVAPANSALSSRPAFHFTAAPTGWTLGAVDGGSTSTGAVSVTSPNLVTDVGVRIQHYLCVNDNTYPPLGSTDGPPPTDTHDTSHDLTQRLTSDLGFVTTRLTNARSEVLSGVTYTRHLQDQNHLVADVAGDSVTSTVHGWGPSYTTWNSALPGGTWVHSMTITAPSGLVGMEDTQSGDFSLLAANPNYRVICGLDIPSDTADADHWSPGTALLCGMVVMNFAADQPLTPDTTPAPTVIVARFDVALGRAEYLASDLTWQPANPGPVYEWPLTVSAGDSTVFTTVFTAAQTAGFSYDGLFLVAKAYISGTPYTGNAALEVTGTSHPHSHPVFDAVAYATGRGLISTT